MESAHHIPRSAIASQSLETVSPPQAPGTGSKVQEAGSARMKAYTQKEPLSGRDLKREAARLQEVAIEHGLDSKHFNPMWIAGHLLQRYKHPKLLLEAFDYLTTHDSRFRSPEEVQKLNVLEEVKKFEFPKVMKARIRQLLAEAAGEPQARIIEKTAQQGRVLEPGDSDLRVQKMAQKMAMYLMPLVQIRDVEVDMAGDQRKAIQRTGHTFTENDVTKMAEKTTNSSETAKIEDVEKATSSATITMKGEVRLTRSGRCDNPDKMLSILLMDAIGRLQTTKGLPNEGTEFEYESTIVSHLDRSWKKAIGKTAESWIKRIKKKQMIPIENEERFAKNIEKTIKELWDPKSEGVESDAKGLFLKKQVAYMEGEQEKIVTIKIRPPKFLNFVFSGQAKTPGNLEAARRSNLGAQLDLLEQFAKKTKIEHKDDILEAIGAYKKANPFNRKRKLQNVVKLVKQMHQEIRTKQNSLDSNLEEKIAAEEVGITKDFPGYDQIIKGALETARKNPDFNQKKLEIAKLEQQKEQLVLLARQELALRGLEIALTGQSSVTYRKYDKPTDPGNEFLYFCTLADIVDTAPLIECKSGNDRTTISAALSCAARDYEESHDGMPFDPDRSKPADLAEFKALFTKYINKFGKRTVEANRGTPALKLKKNPIFQHWIDTPFDTKTGQWIGDIGTADRGIRLIQSGEV